MTDALPPRKRSSTISFKTLVMKKRPCAFCSCRSTASVGRVDDAVRLVEERWEHLNETGEGAWERAIKMLRLHIELTSDVTPAENVRAYLDRASRQAPDDDLVRLGLANLAIREGAYDQAERWLDACRQRRPTDASVWQARLDWGLATGRVDVVNDALEPLAGDRDDSGANFIGYGRGSAHIAAMSASERRELELLIAADPADLDGSRTARPDRAARRAAGSSVGMAAREGTGRTVGRALQAALPAEPARPGCGRDGRPCQTAWPRLRGPGFSHAGNCGKPRAGRSAADKSVELSKRRHSHFNHHSAGVSR